ncbi:MAG: FAD-dependent oxidoreductase [Actinobacteria bacterium]|nr:FAD-dependent oxidoreductase [Actinomycetota bacterium]
MKVIVVGAGPAGLAATYTLKKQGADVVALESTDKPGGRAQGLEKDGYVFDMGAQFLGKHYETTFRFCRELGMMDDVIPFNFKVAIYRKGKMYPLSMNMNPVEQLKMIPDYLRFRAISIKAIFEMARMMPRLMQRMPAAFKMDFLAMSDVDYLSIADFVLRYGGKSALEEVFQMLMAGLTLGEPEDIGAAHGLSLFNFGRGLLALKHGMGSLTDSIYDACKDKVKLSTPVKKIVIDGKYIKGVETEDGFLEADHVICATTAGTVRRLTPDLPDAIRKPLEMVKYSSTRHVVFALEKRLLPEGWYPLSFSRQVGSFLPAIVDSSCKSPNHAPPGAGQIHCFTYGRKAADYNDVPEEELKKLMIKEVQKFFPNMPDTPLFSVYCRWDEAICLEPPGMLNAIRRMKMEGMKKVRGLHLAGSYMRLLSSVEGSLASGVDAAYEVLK